MTKLTNAILLNVLLMASCSAVADMPGNDIQTVESLSVEKKVRNGQSLHTAMIETSPSQHSDVLRPGLAELHGGEKSKLFKKLPEHLIAGN